MENSLPHSPGRALSLTVWQLRMGGPSLSEMYRGVFFSCIYIFQMDLNRVDDSVDSGVGLFLHKYRTKATVESLRPPSDMPVIEVHIKCLGGIRFFF